MNKPRQTSVVILVTLAELAWLAAIGLLFAYRVKVGEITALKHEIDHFRAERISHSLLGEEHDRTLRHVTNLQTRLDTFSNQFKGLTVEEVTKLVRTSGEAEIRLRATEEKAKVLAEEVESGRVALAESKSAVRARDVNLVEAERKLNALPPNAVELSSLYRDATNKVSAMNAKTVVAGLQLVGLSNRISQLEQGEVAIRRELIGLPATSLRRVIFIVDTSSSMRNSPAWNNARSLIRLWLEYLPVEECVLIHFNDTATGFPSEGYLRIRESGGTSLPTAKADLLMAFDRGTIGTFSDLLKGLQLAYSRPNPDLIVLFADGHPHVATKPDGAIAGAILREASAHPNIPIISVAVGSYEVENAGGPNERRNAAISFLKALAKSTDGGSFIAR